MILDLLWLQLERLFIGNRWVAVLDRWLHEVAGLWDAGDYILATG